MPLLAATPALAQREDGQLWLQVNINVPLTDRLRVTLEQIACFSDDQDGLCQTAFGALRVRAGRSRPENEDQPPGLKRATGR